MASNSHHLKFPQVLLTDLFLRSSVESLLRAKCVCKHWYYLIKNPTFVLDHLQFQKIHNKGRLLVQYYNGDIERYGYALFDDEALRTYHDLDHHFQFNLGSIHMDGPINGLYCLFNYEARIVLWNPALKEFGTFPPPHPHFFHHLELDIWRGRIGFGMDPLTYVYKLVLIRSFNERIEPEDEHLDVCPDKYVTVYNLSTNTWRLVDVGEFSIRNYDLENTINSSFLDGIYYWWGRKLCGTGVLIAFNMGKETFREILGPNTCSDGIPFLTLYNSKVAMFFQMTTGVDIWAMLEGVWIKQISFTKFPRAFYEVGVWKNDVFLCTNFSQPLDFNNSHIVLYFATTHEMRNVGPRGAIACFEASIFYESLVSISFELENKGKHKSLKTISDLLTLGRNTYLDIKQ